MGVAVEIDGNKNAENIASEANKAVNGQGDPKHINLEGMSLLVHKEVLDHLHKKTKNELSSLTERQEWVSDLHKLHRAINAATDSKTGEVKLDLNDPDMMNLMHRVKNPHSKRDPSGKAGEHAKQKGTYTGLELDHKKGAYKKEDRERLIENIKMAVEDLNVQNDMQLQTLNRLMNERYEAYQMIRTIMKPLHDDKIQKARALAGR